MDLCTIASGSSGNCTFTGTSNTSLLVDVGLSGKRIEAGLHSIGRKPEEIDAILITHEHIDHIQGLGVMARRYHIPIYTTPGTAEYLISCSQLGKIDMDLFHFIEPDVPFTIRDLTVTPFRIWHDAAQPVGFRVTDGRKKAAVATDMGCYDEYITQNLLDLDGLVLESNHDVNMLEAGSYPWPLKQRILGQYGHLSNVHAGRLLCEILNDHMKAIMLGHLSKENNYEALAFATVASEVAMGDNPYKAEDLPISVAPRSEPSRLFEI